jgi:regulator of RNase E activity RraA
MTATHGIDARRELVEELRGCPTSTLCDALAKSGKGKIERMVMAGLSPVSRPNGRVVGPARTMQMEVVRDPRRSAIVADRPLAFSLVDGASEGDFLVVAAPVGPPYAIWGGVLALQASLRGAVGAVVDGMTRDVAEIDEVGFSVWCRGITPVPGGYGGYSCKAVDVPVTCGGVEVLPGDYVVADADGVVVLGPGLVREVVAVAKQLIEAELHTERELRAGRAMQDAYPSRGYYATGEAGE